MPVCRAYEQLRERYEALEARLQGVSQQLAEATERGALTATLQVRCEYHLRARLARPACPLPMARSWGLRRGAWCLPAGPLPALVSEPSRSGAEQQGRDRPLLGERCLSPWPAGAPQTKAKSDTDSNPLAFPPLQEKLERVQGELSALKEASHAATEQKDQGGCRLGSI